VSVVDPSGAELCLRAIQQRGPSVLAQPLVQRALRAAIERGDPSVDQGLFDALGKYGLVGERAIRAVNEYVTWHPAKAINQDLSLARTNGLLNSDSESTAKGSQAAVASATSWRRTMALREPNVSSESVLFEAGLELWGITRVNVLDHQFVVDALSDLGTRAGINTDRAQRIIAEAKAEVWRRATNTAGGRSDVSTQITRAPNGRASEHTEDRNH
jgi:hypothetical protein